MIEPRYKYEIATAGLLHDIGKLYQKLSTSSLYRKDSSEHPLIAEDFIKMYRIVFKQVYTEEELHFIIECAKRHHSGVSFSDECRPDKAEKELKKYCEIIDKADNISSMERSEKGNSRKENAIMHSIMTTQEDIDNHEHKVVQLGKFSKFSPDKVVKVVKSDKVPYHTDEDYKKLLDAFEKDFSSIEASTKEELFNKMLRVLGEYTRCVPSACNTKIHDVSLYQHLVTTSALSSAIYNNICMYSTEELFNVNAADLNKFDFSVLTVKLDRAEEYINKIDLRGLDVFTVMSEKDISLHNRFNKVIEEILTKLNLTSANLVLTSGYEQYIIVNDGVKEELQEVVKEINNSLVEEYEGELIISYSLTKLKFEENTMKSLFVGNLEEYHDGMVEYLYDNGWKEEKVQLPNRYKGVCKCCGRLNTDKDICKVCEEEIKKKVTIKETLKDCKRIAIMAIDGDNVVDTLRNKLVSDTTISRVNTYSETIANFFQNYIKEEYGDLGYIVNLNPNKVLFLCDNESALLYAQEIRELFKKYTDDKLTLSIVIQTVGLNQRIVTLNYDKELRRLKNKGGDLVSYNGLDLNEVTLDWYINSVEELLNSYDSLKGTNETYKSVIQRLKTYGLEYKELIDKNKMSNLLFVSKIYKDVGRKRFVVLNKEFQTRLYKELDKVVARPNVKNQFYYMLAEIVYDVEVSLRKG